MRPLFVHLTDHLAAIFTAGSVADISENDLVAHEELN